MIITVKFNIPDFNGFRSVEAEEQFLEDVAVAASQNEFIQGHYAVEADIASIHKEIRAKSPVRRYTSQGGIVAAQRKEGE